MAVRRPILVVFCLGCIDSSCLPVLQGSESDLSGQHVELTLLHTADIHSRLIPYNFTPVRTDTDLGLIREAFPFGGGTRLATLLKRERARSVRVLHLDSGDAFEGAPIFEVHTGEAEYLFLSKIRVDAATIGNHEFDAGAINFTLEARDHANFPVLAANYVWEDPRTLESLRTANDTAPYTLKNVKGIRVGIVGLGNTSALALIGEGGNPLQITPLEQNEAMRAYVELLRPSVDLVIVVSHLGLIGDQQLIRGYTDVFEYGRIKSFLTRPSAPWEIRQWYGPIGSDSTQVLVGIPGVSGIDVILGGHNHVVLNPPQTLTDPSGRQVILAHSGAFARYLGRVDLVVQMPQRGAAQQAQVLSYAYRVFPVDSLWCDDGLRNFYQSRTWNPGEFRALPEVRAGLQRCQDQEDRTITQLLQPYIVAINSRLPLATIFAYAPRDIVRRDSATGGDAPLGNLCADAMRTRPGIDAELAITNSLSVRDNLYAGPINEESMFNIFPFETRISLLSLSGAEVQASLDVVTERSAALACETQAQVSGIRFTMDCAQVQLNDLRYPCDPSRTGDANGSDCPTDRSPGHAPWTCIAADSGQGRCWAHPATDISVSGRPLNLNGIYRSAASSFIAEGGAGFAVLKRNPTRRDTGVLLRNAVIGHMRSFCDCSDINAGLVVGRRGSPCGTLVDGQWVVDDQTKQYCRDASDFESRLATAVASCTCREVLQGNATACGVAAITPELTARCSDRPGPNAGNCNCLDVLKGNENACGPITQELHAFCDRPTLTANTIGVQDGRISRRVR